MNFQPEMIDGNVHQWIDDVLLNHEGNEVCESAFLPMTPLGAPAWKVTQPNGHVDVYLSEAATRTAIERLAHQLAPHRRP
jgi:hypothetical protein